MKISTSSSSMAFGERPGALEKSAWLWARVWCQVVRETKGAPSPMTSPFMLGVQSVGFGIYMDLYGFIYHTLPGSMAFKHQMSHLKLGCGLWSPIFHQLQVWQRVGETQTGPCAAEVSHCQPAPMLFLLLVRFLLGIQPGLIGLVQQIRYNQLQHYQQLTLPRSPWSP